MATSDTTASPVQRGIDPPGKGDEVCAEFALPRGVCLRRKALPRIELAVRRDHHGAVARRGTLRIAFVGYRYKHVIAITKRQGVVVQELVVREILAGDFSRLQGRLGRRPRHHLGRPGVTTAEVRRGASAVTGSGPNRAASVVGTAATTWEAATRPRRVTTR